MIDDEVSIRVVATAINPVDLKTSEGSVAEDIGLEACDVITDIGGRPAYSPQRLQHLIAESFGASTITLIRNGESQQLQAEYSMLESADTDDKAALGIRMQALPEYLKEAFGADGSQGVLISLIITGSAASQAGLKAGDVVVGIAATHSGRFTLPSPPCSI